jgi:PKD repeat protein
MGNQNSINILGNDVFPFSLSSNGDIITQTDARPDLNSYKRIQFGFASKFPATIKVLACAFGNTPGDSTNRPTYAWIEQISTGTIYYFFGDTAKIEIPANLNFTADFYLHTGPYIATNYLDETCFGAYDGELSVSNPNCSAWNLTIYKNAVLLFSDSIFQQDTTISTLTAGTYTVITYINSIPVDSTEIIIGSEPQIIADFTIDNYTPTTDDTVNFTNISTVPSSVSYYWSFGDGNDDNQTSTSNRYFLPGAYEIVLTITSASGCQATVFDSVWVTATSSGGNDLMSQGAGFGQVFENTNTVATTDSKHNPVSMYAGESNRIMITQIEAAPVSIIIMNVSGQVISTTETDNTKIELEVPATGIYIVRVINAKKEVQVKTIMVAN